LLRGQHLHRIGPGLWWIEHLSAVRWRRSALLRWQRLHRFDDGVWQWSVSRLRWSRPALLRRFDVLGGWLLRSGIEQLPRKRIGLFNGRNLQCWHLPSLRRPRPSLLPRQHLRRRRLLRRGPVRCFGTEHSQHDRFGLRKRGDGRMRRQQPALLRGEYLLDFGSVLR
jgi:hypothetical protein